MKDIVLTLPSLMFIVGTRAALAFGAGLLVAGSLSAPQRRGLGLTLVAVGVATTPPALLHVFGRLRHPATAAARAHALRLV
jgi:hypothetical protein